jgi:predicted permease
MWLADLRGDIQFALRSFQRSPGFVSAALLVLGLGIGGVSLMLGTLDSVVLRPLPFPDSGRLVWFWGTREGTPRNSISAETYRDYRTGVGAFESVGAFLVFRPPAVVTGGDEPERIVTTIVSASLFPTLGVVPSHGRGFVEEDESPAAGHPLLVSRALAERYFAAPSAAVGSTLDVDGQPRVIVGVMPSGFDYPGEVDAWLPLRMDQGYAQGRGNNNFWAVGRLAAGSTLELAQSQADVLARTLEETYPETNQGWRIRFESLQERTVAGSRPALLMLTGLVALLLLVACANVASISMARATSRGRELAVRLSLGASRSRVARQLLTEHVVLSVGGGILGVAFAWAGTRAVRAFGPAGMPRLETVSLDVGVLLLTLVVTLVTGIAFGLLPSLSGTRMSLSATLRAGGTGARGPVRAWGRNLLAVTQVALSLVLLVAAGLLVRSFARLQAVDPGFRSDGLLVAELGMLDGRYQTDAEVHQVWDLVFERLRALPGVVSVAATDQAPIRAGGTYNSIFAEGRKPASVSEYTRAERRFVSERYFATLGIPRLAGRDFATTDDRSAPFVTVVGQGLANELWPGENPIGQKLIWGDVGIEVVGVVGDIKDFGPASDARPTFYLPARQLPRSMSTLRVLIRTETDPLQLAGAVRSAVWKVDPEMPVSAIETMEARLAASLAQPRFRTRLVGVFAAMALLLAGLGVYGVLAHLVRQRAHELAVRQALGATGPDLVGLVLTRGMALVAIGVSVGLAGGAVGARLMRSFLFEVAPTDVLTYGGVTLMLVAAGAVACLVPAGRAVRVAPADALKAD